MEFILTYLSGSQYDCGYEVMTIRGNTLDLALCEYEGSQEDIVSIVRVF